MSFFKEFKEFISRGNVVDLAVGVIIGGAFGKITSSLVEDIIMPPIGMLIAGIDFAKLKYIIRPQQLDSLGKVTREAVAINYGQFIQTVVNFLIIAFAVFLMVKGINMLRRKVEHEAEEKKESPPPPEEKLLTEIRDILKNMGGSTPAEKREESQTS